MLPKLILCFGTALGLVACGSSSQVNAGRGPDSGAPTGGAGASGSSGGKAGSGGSSHAGDAAPSGGGSGGGGISDSGVAGTAGSGGSAGGAGGRAGSGTGGAAGGRGGTAGASGGAAGADAGTTTPRCDPLCTSFTSAACASGPTRAGCLLTCRALTSSAACTDRAKAYFDCAAGPTIQCNANGEPVAQGCGVQYLQAIGCAVTETPNPGVVAPCSDYCDKVVVQSCPNNGAKPECTTNCLWAGATGTGCDDEWLAYLDCANAAQASCLLGFAVFQGCGVAFRAYSACINAAGGP